MLEILAGIALILFIANTTHLYFPNLTNLFFIYLFFGLLGAIIEFYFTHVLAWRKLTLKWPPVWAGLTNRDTWLPIVIVSLIISAIHSAMWPSGTLEGVINNGADFSFWLFMAEYQLGLIDITNPQLISFTQFQLDAPGVQMLIALMSLSRAELPFEAAPALIVIFLSWFGASVYHLVRQVFKFSFFQALFVSQALCLSSFLNYIAMMGMLPHLFSLTVFIVILTQVFKDQNDKNIIPNYTKLIFFPLFLLFIAYQATYILFASYTIMSIFIFAFLSLHLQYHKRILKCLYLSVCPVLLVTILSGLLAPGLAAHVFLRSGEALRQVPGWSLPSISPLLFTGIPLFLSTKQYIPDGPDIGNFFKYYLLLIFLLILITVAIYYYAKYKLQTINNVYNIMTIVSIFIISLIFYISIQSLFGNIYRIWKYSAYTILPLSFIPLSVLLYFIIQITKFKLLKLTNIILILLIIFYSAHISNKNYFQGLKHDYYFSLSRNFFLSSLSNLTKKYNNSTFLFNFSEPSLIFLSAMILSKTTNKLYYYPALYFFAIKPYLIKNFSENTVFITNTNYKNILNSTRFSEYFPIEPLHIYDYNAIKDKGYVEISSNITPFLFYISNYPVHYSFIVPSKLVNRNLVFAIALTPEQNLSPACKLIEFGLHGEDGQIVWHPKSVNDLTFPIPANLTVDGRLEVFTKMTFVKGEKCQINIYGVNLKLAPADNPDVTDKLTDPS
ncbi:MAG: hypothetical protein LBJ61_04760 [Deltaproteobacteria bacterium]|nr:hypothetical protein [Deltaproteobacteria bacterium]